MLRPNVRGPPVVAAARFRRGAPLGDTWASGQPGGASAG
jgi:hypothetical protein